MKSACFFIVFLILLGSCKPKDVVLTDDSLIAIPDTAFEYYLVQFRFDSDKTVNGHVRYGDINRIDTLYVMPATFPWPTITSLKGIEYFTNLKYLECRAWAINELDVSHNKNLEYLNCSGFPSYEVGFPPPPQVKQLIFGEANTKLKILDCSRNLMTSVDLSPLTALTELYCTANLLTTLDVSHNPNLNVCWTYASSQLKTICVASLSQVDSSRAPMGPGIGGSVKWRKDPTTAYQVCK